MNVSPINHEPRSHSLITPKTTGYAATVSLGVAVMSGISKNKTLRKMHKPAAYLTTFFVAMHIAIMESYRKRYKKL